MRRIEDKVRTLCARLLETKNDEELTLIVVELRGVLKRHIERARRRLADYPRVFERRSGESDSVATSQMDTPQNFH